MKGSRLSGADVASRFLWTDRFTSAPRAVAAVVFMVLWMAPVVMVGIHGSSEWAWAAQGRGLLPPPECGNNVIESLEQCDGTADGLCPGECLPPGDPNECFCPFCGDDSINQVDEECDGPDLGLCTDGCNPSGGPEACKCVVPAVCGDGIVTPPGEVCEPGSAEICNNFIDDDGDGLIDCDDTADCPEGGTTCGADCLEVVACQRPTSDPASIRFYDDSVSLDRFRMHAQFIPETLVDPAVEGFSIQIINAGGVVFSGQVLGTDLAIKRQGKRFRFHGRTPDRRHTAGIYYLLVKKKAEKYAFRLRAYADLSAVDGPRMTTHVVIGNDGASVTADWTAVRHGWRLRGVDFNKGG